MGVPCQRGRSSTFTSTPSTPFSTGPAGFPRSRLARPSSRCRPSSRIARVQAKGYAHLTLLAADNSGYSNLIKLASAGYLEGYYYKPRVDWELLDRHSSGLLALSGCLSGRVSKALEESRPGDAAQDLDRLVQI